MHRLNMFLIGALVTAPAVLWSQTTIPGNLVSFYEVPLACPAARGLGCRRTRLLRERSVGAQAPSDVSSALLAHLERGEFFYLSTDGRSSRRF